VRAGLHPVNAAPAEHVAVRGPRADGGANAAPAPVSAALALPAARVQLLSVVPDCRDDAVVVVSAATSRGARVT
jgi:hypothetical protein